MNVKIKRINPDFSDLPLPSYQTKGSAGMDLTAAIDKSITLAAGSTSLVPTGLAMALPEGFECQVRSRSGLAAKYGIFALNAPGTIDSDYRGEIKVILSNFGSEPFVINRGDRIAQIVIARYEQVCLELTEELPETSRGSGGFGSTGI